RNEWSLGGAAFPFFVFEMLPLLLLVDLVVGAVLDVLHLVRNILSGPVGAIFGFMFAMLGLFVHGVFGIAPGFFGGAFGLVGHSAVRHALVSERFSGFLFNFSCYLICLAACLVLVHDLLLICGCGVPTSLDASEL